FGSVLTSVHTPSQCVSSARHGDVFGARASAPPSAPSVADLISHAPTVARATASGIHRGFMHHLDAAAGLGASDLQEGVGSCAPGGSALLAAESVADAGGAGNPPSAQIRPCGSPSLNRTRSYARMGANTSGSWSGQSWHFGSVEPDAARMPL